MRSSSLMSSSPRSSINIGVYQSSVPYPFFQPFIHAKCSDDRRSATQLNCRIRTRSISPEQFQDPYIWPHGRFSSLIEKYVFWTVLCFVCSAVCPALDVELAWSTVKPTRWDSARYSGSNGWARSHFWLLTDVLPTPTRAGREDLSIAEADHLFRTITTVVCGGFCVFVVLTVRIPLTDRLQQLVQRPRLMQAEYRKSS